MKWWLFILIILHSVFLVGQEKYDTGPVRQYPLVRVRIEESNPKIISQLSRNYGLVNREEGFVEIEIPESMFEIVAEIFNAELLGPAAISLDEMDMAQNLDEAFTFLKYPTYSQYLQMMSLLAANFPTICKVDTIGTSVEGRYILALKLSDKVHLEEGEAKFFFTSTMHGDELVGYVLLLRLANYLLQEYETQSHIKTLLDSLEIWINPLANPDGTYKYDEQSVATSVRYNVNGLDLNRNYPMPGINEPDDTTGRQPETIAMMEFMQKNKFSLSANLHSGAEVVNYPWDHTLNRHPDDTWFIKISSEYATSAHSVDSNYMTTLEGSPNPSGITHGADWFIVTGSRQDFVTYYRGGREVTLELSFIKRLESEELDTFWIRNKDAMIGYMSQALYGIRGTVTNSLNGEPLCAKLYISGHDDDHSWIRSDSSFGRFYRLIDEGVFDLIISADGFITDTIFGVEVQNHNATWLDVRLDSVNNPSAISQDLINPSNQLTIYPNPAGKALNIKLATFTGKPIRFSIYNLDGRKIQSNTIHQYISVIKIDITDLAKGLYVLKIESEDFISTQKFVKQ